MTKSHSLRETQYIEENSYFLINDEMNDFRIFENNYYVIIGSLKMKHVLSDSVAPFCELKESYHCDI